MLPIQHESVEFILIYQFRLSVNIISSSQIYSEYDIQCILLNESIQTNRYCVEKWIIENYLDLNPPISESW